MYARQIDSLIHNAPMLSNPLCSQCECEMCKKKVKINSSSCAYEMIVDLNLSIS